MNKSVISKDEILSVCKEMIKAHGLNSLNMRAVAKECNVSVGSIYNYFSSKGDLILNTVECIWIEVINDFSSISSQHKFDESVVMLFDSMKKCSKKYSSFLNMHSILIDEKDKLKGREVMNKYFSLIKTSLLVVLENDKRVQKNLFDNKFTKEKFIDFIFSSILSALIRQDNDIEFLVQIIRRIVHV